MAVRYDSGSGCEAERQPRVDGQDRQEDEALSVRPTDEEWEAIAPLMPQPGRRGRPREVECREEINAVRLSGPFGLWLAHAAGPLRALATVYGWFRELARRFLFQTSTTWH